MKHFNLRGWTIEIPDKLGGTRFRFAMPDEETIEVYDADLPPEKDPIVRASNPTIGLLIGRARFGVNERCLRFPPDSMSPYELASIVLKPIAPRADGLKEWRPFDAPVSAKQYPLSSQWTVLGNQPGYTVIVQQLGSNSEERWQCDVLCDATAKPVAWARLAPELDRCETWINAGADREMLESISLRRVSFIGEQDQVWVPFHSSGAKGLVVVNEGPRPEEVVNFRERWNKAVAVSGEGPLAILEVLQSIPVSRGSIVLIETDPNVSDRILREFRRLMYAKVEQAGLIDQGVIPIVVPRGTLDITVIPHAMEHQKLVEDVAGIERKQKQLESFLDRWVAPALREVVRLVAGRFELPDLVKRLRMDGDGRPEDLSSDR